MCFEAAAAFTQALGEQRTLARVHSVLVTCRSNVALVAGAVAFALAGVVVDLLFFVLVLAAASSCPQDIAGAQTGSSPACLRSLLHVAAIARRLPHPSSKVSPSQFASSSSSSSTNSSRTSYTESCTCYLDPKISTTSQLPMCQSSTSDASSAKCTHPNHIRNPPPNEEYDLVAISDGFGRFDTIPFMGVLDQWRQDETPSSIPGNHAGHILDMLNVQSSCYCYEQVLYCNVITCMLEVFDTHGPRMLRNKKKIGGSYYYNLCEMLKEPDNTAASATFMMAVTTGKRQDMLMMVNTWTRSTMKPTQLTLWTLFHDLIAISDEELDETIQSWAQTSKEWSMAMIHLKCAHRKLQKESPLCLTEIYDTEQDRQTVQRFIQECLRAGDDRTAISTSELANSRHEILQISRNMSVKACTMIKKLTPYDLDLLKFYVVALCQICTTGNLIMALVAWKCRRADGMEKFRSLALERMSKDVTMQELAGCSSGSDIKFAESDSETSASDTIPTVSPTSVYSEVTKLGPEDAGLTPGT
ncbi:hypothetical protein ABW21_db0207215 [Orbilia brochopaga]|nr:hypothetical protein ABW21_db0207215 [Drechslerella brochopaga]